MSDLEQRSTGGPRRFGGHLRVGDVEREAAVAALEEHRCAGRLSSVEYEERSVQAGRARQWADLHPLFADLPEPRPAPGAVHGRAPLLRLPSASAPAQPWVVRLMRVAPLVAAALTLITGNWAILVLVPVLYVLLRPSLRAARRRPDRGFPQR